MNTSTSGTKQSKRRKTWRLLLTILGALILIRLILPYIVLYVVNKNLAEISGYYGHVDDIDLSLYRGAYVVKDLYINKVDTVTKKQTELLTAPKIDISIEWKSLLRGRIVSEMEFASPTLRFTSEAAEPEQMEKDTNDFRKILKTFTPMSLNRFEIFDGTIGYLDPNAKPVVDIAIKNAHILAHNLSNIVDTTALPAKVEATADVYGGSVSFNMRVDALAEVPTYDMNVELKDADLTQLNDMFQAYGKFDVNRGTFGMYMEMAAKDRKFLGYVKPFINDLDVVGKEDRTDNLLRKIWEGIVGIVGDILEAPKTDYVATKVPIAGEYDNRSIGIWYAVFAALRNGLFQALVPSLDNQVNLQTVNKVQKDDVGKSGFFNKVFGGPGEADKKKKSESKKDE